MACDTHSQNESPKKDEASPFRVLVLYFSQTGDTNRVAQLFADQFSQRGGTVQFECLKAKVEYPFPWRNPILFFNVLPECLLGPPPAMQPVSWNPSCRFDLVILVYPVWFLSPALPVQSFFAGDAAEVLKNCPVVTVSVSRNMWQSASERMKQLLHAAGARHLDNVTVTHQGPPWATFLTTPRWLLFGRADPFWFFPPAGLGQQEYDRVQRIAQTLAERWGQRHHAAHSSFLQGTGAVQLTARYLIPEAIGWYLFRAWAYILKGLGAIHPWLRLGGICGFMVFLVCIVGLGLPIMVALTWLFQPFLRPALDAYARHLAAPSGTAVATETAANDGTTGSHDE